MASILYTVALLITCIGAFNWALSAYRAKEGGRNLVHKLLKDKKEGEMLDTPAAWNSKEKLVYYIVGVAAVVLLITSMNRCK